jgi:ABC-type Zn uptake system ZnuABC Zn-binding protein ZnuA
VIFAEDPAGKTELEKAFGQTGATIGVLYTLERSLDQNDTYESLMRKNLDALTKAMK